MDEITALLATKPTSLIEVSVQVLSKERSKSIGLLASPSSIKTMLFEKPLREAGINVMLPSLSSQTRLEQCIRHVIAGMPATSQQPLVLTVVQELKSRGAQKVILGCTELSVIFEDTANRDLFDPLEAITKQILTQDMTSEYTRTV